uniref:Partial AB-hydrolase lipase domain-containing protein n=1 Tax=Kalanchoe fedtschenkoi TaxID=63787 RepID=A0A7N0U139_KALFE
MRRLVDTVLAVAKESVKTFTYESLNNIARLINGISALLLTLLPEKASVLEGIHGWELKPSFRGPWLPRWMENDVSSFNQFIHDLSVDSDDTSNYDRRAAHWIRLIFMWILLPARILIGMPFYFFRILLRRGSGPSSTPWSPHHPHLHSVKKAHALKDHVIQHTIDRRRGVIEDLHVATEIIIEAVFDVFHKAVHVVLSPSEAIKILLRSHSYQRPACDNPTERRTNFQSMNTDARTCLDVITELGYPYEAIQVVTSDGYVLLLERIPRRDSRMVLYLQHGILDSSMGWVSNGVVGSPAFAAYDQGMALYLIRSYLGNLRGLTRTSHRNSKSTGFFLHAIFVHKMIRIQSKLKMMDSLMMLSMKLTVLTVRSIRYWNYSINEHGTEDIPAMIDRIHQIEVSELGNSQTDSLEGASDEQPYKLCAVSHSLGVAAILTYVITRRIEERAHRMSRLVLLSPAGFHDDSSIVFTMVEYVFLWLSPLLALIIPAFYIPTRFFRMLLNKLARDFLNFPAVRGLVQTLMNYVVGGDSSNWVGVLGLPHYNMNDMSGVSFHVAQHLAQIKHAKKFIMYDYGRHEGEYYGLIDIPVDLVAGKKDTVIQPSMVKKHYRLLKSSGVEVSYNEYEYGHLDFTFSHHEELQTYVMSRLLLAGPSTKQSLRSGGLRKRD